VLGRRLEIDQHWRRRANPRRLDVGVRTRACFVPVRSKHLGGKILAVRLIVTGSGGEHDDDKRVERDNPRIETEFVSGARSHGLVFCVSVFEATRELDGRLPCGGYQSKGEAAGQIDCGRSIVGWRSASARGMNIIFRSRSASKISYFHC
jgi:hypothetical protein